jgi:signal transduction histidine kinase
MFPSLGTKSAPRSARLRIGEGTGPGLWISYGIAREHGGELISANEPEGGVTFSFALVAHSEVSASRK